MSERTKRRSAVVQVPADPGSVSVLVDESLKPGSNLSFGFPDGRVSLTRDHLGDWTIMVGLSTRSDWVVSAMFSLESLGFFKATEAEGMAYFLWTSTLDDSGDARSLVEATLVETLKALQRSGITRYIC